MDCQECGRANSLARVKEGHPGGLPWSGSVFVAGTHYIVQRDEGHYLPQDNHVQRLSGKAVAFISPSDVVVPMELPITFTPTVPLAATPLRKEGLQLLIGGGLSHPGWRGFTWP